MTTSIEPQDAAVVTQPEQTFPELTEEQIGRVAALGRTRRVEAGEVLVSGGAQVAHFYVVCSGAVEVV